MKSTLSNNDVLDALRDQLLPWLRSSLVKVLLAQPPLKLPPEIATTELALPLLIHTRQRQSGLVQAHWPDAGVNSALHPCFICILEGSADMRVGITQRMATANRALAGSGGALVLKLPRFSLFVIPPGVPYSDGSKAHNEDGSADARSHILWMQIVPEGLSAHTCRSQGTLHSQSSALFAANSRLRPLAEMVISSLQEEAPPHLTNSLLLSLVAWLIHDLEMAPQTADHAPLPLSPLSNSISGDRCHPNAPPLKAPVQRACDYIHSRLSHALTVEIIARHAFISASHLNRLFRSELGLSVMAYVTQRRIRAAQSLLRETEYSIQQISQQLGYAHPPHFSRVFSRETGVTPTLFRHRLLK